MKFTYDTEFSDERPQFVICTRCDGHGKIVHPDCSVWTHSDIAEDPDGFEDMMNGDYDIGCPDCGGMGRLATIHHRMHPWHGLSGEKLIAAAEERAERAAWVASDYAMERAERLAGC